ncbi:hypothetical protein [Curtobacterium sp. L1-20]|uniref:hypothetical protein n=1 Tax=Curtobacterium sp. L1-20 TaxID=3138181 RepID=UPI003B523B4F
MTEPTRTGHAPDDEIYESLTPEDREAQYERLQGELKEHPGYIASRQWQELGRAQRVWSLNTGELLGLLQALEDEEELKIELIQNVRPPDGRVAIMAGLDQRLHNMLAAATSLVDHTRRHMTKYAETAFAEHFEKRNTAVADAPSSMFLRKFRNYLLHVGSAPFNTHAQFPTEHTEFDTIQLDIRLDAASLLTWSGWNATTRTYIGSFPDGVPLAQAVREYAAAMKQLYAWVNEQFEVLHGGDIDEINDLVRRINLTMTSGAWDGREPEKYWAQMEENVKRFDRGEPQIDVRTGQAIEGDELHAMPDDPPKYEAQD